MENSSPGCVLPRSCGVSKEWESIIPMYLLRHLFETTDKFLRVGKSCDKQEQYIIIYRETHFSHTSTHNRFACTRLVHDGAVVVMGCQVTDSSCFVPLHSQRDPWVDVLPCNCETKFVQISRKFAFLILKGSLHCWLSWVCSIYFLHPRLSMQLRWSWNNPLCSSLRYFIIYVGCLAIIKGNSI